MKNTLKATMAALLIGAMSISFSVPALAQTAQPYNQYQPNYSLPPLQGRVATIPAYTTFSGITYEGISSESLVVGSPVNIVLPAGFNYNGSLVFPAGSTVNGNVVLVQKSGRTGKPGKIKVHFTNVTTPNGQRYGLSGQIATQDGTGTLVGGTSTQRAAGVAKNAAVGAGTGALFGTIIGAITGRTGRGAWAGTAVGGGLGLANSVIQKGTAATILPNTKVDIMLDQPATLGGNSNYGY